MNKKRNWKYNNISESKRRFLVILVAPDTGVHNCHIITNPPPKAKRYTTALTKYKTSESGESMAS